MITKLKVSSGDTIVAGQIVRFPFGKDETERTVYGTFEGVHGSSKLRTIGMALTRANSTKTKAVSVMNLLDEGKVILGRTCIFYPKGVPMRPVTAEEEATYKKEVAAAIIAKQNDHR